MKRYLIISTILALLIVITTASMAADDIVIADFEGGSYGNWTATGQAFGEKPASGTLPNQMLVQGYRGTGLINSFLNGDGTQGTLTSPEFKIERSFINFLIGGGYNPGMTCMNLVADGKIIRTATGANDEYLKWASWDVADLQGKSVHIEIVDTALIGWGHILVDQIVQSNRRLGPLQMIQKKEKLYAEKYRPQFHFTAAENWTNDPNGLVFYKGTYHLFFQHNPTGISWGNMTWGHAVSHDLIHWKQLEDAIHPDALGTIFSGSAVVDWRNTSGFSKGAEKPIIAFYTAAGDPVTQCIAYSNDGGRTLTKYEGNPVLPNIRGGNRDPKVIWYEPEKKWIMSLFTEEDTYTLLESKDTKHWTKLQDIVFTGHSECPDFFSLKVEASDEIKWILCASNSDYFIGSFDGKQFKIESGPFQGDYGSNYYATQTYSDEPKGRRIQLAWMAGGQYPGMPFNQQMNFPTELKLNRYEDGLRISRMPIKEIERLYEDSWSIRNKVVKPGNDIQSYISGDLLDIKAEIDLRDADEVGICTRNETIRFTTKDDMLSCLGKSAKISPINNRIKLRILVDRTSIEVYANDGRVVMTSCFLPKAGGEDVSIYSTGGSSKIISMNVHRLKSIWQNIKKDKIDSLP